MLLVPLNFDFISFSFSFFFVVVDEIHYDSFDDKGRPHTLKNTTSNVIASVEIVINDAMFSGKNITKYVAHEHIGTATSIYFVVGLSCLLECQKLRKTKFRNTRSVRFSA